MNVDNYKTKIKQLIFTIENGLSFDEVADARIELISIYSKLIDKFGTEKSVIESITNAINGQTDALDELM